MNYKKIYDQLVEKCKVRGLDKSVLKGYYEKHHIVPKCMGGSDDVENFVLFTGREHLVAHLLLWKAYPSNKGIAFAVNIMANRTGSKNTSRLYQKLKEEVTPRPSHTEGFMFKDKTGMRFGNLKVDGIHTWIPKHGGHNLPVWRCTCDCGVIINIRGNHLTDKGTKSCGCLLSKSMSLSHSSKFPWERSRVKERWLLADTYYDDWCRFGRPKTSWLFSQMYKNEDGEMFSSSFFGAILNEFLKGWIPSEDIAWKIFKGLEIT